MLDPLTRDVTLVLGGVRSGKSRYAQQLAERVDRVTFVATAESRDDAEMLRKINRHREERPAHWLTIEEPLELPRVLAAAGPTNDVILIDCLTLFAANLLEAHGEDSVAIDARVKALCAALQSATSSVVLVSNEVGSGVVPAYALGRRFRDLVGEINQRVAAVADTVLLMVAGLPLVLQHRRAGACAMKGFLVAGTASGVGKTTVTMAILAAMRRRGKIVQAFKGGPDFLDTGHHTRISGRIARNLDTWMLPFEANRQVLADASHGADLAIVEGMMGLFDGKSGDSEAGSSAEIAKLLKLPVVLVLDAGKTARSIAAVVLGFELFDPQISIAGVIFNRCASERHFNMLKTAVLTSCKSPIFGWLPREQTISIPERHLGLQTVEEAGDDALATEKLIDALATLAEEHLDLDAMLKLACGTEIQHAPAAAARPETSGIRIGVARDRAFSFYYEDNLDLLRQEGATIVPFSPMTDAVLPDGLDALYLGGGYPELYAEQLSRNTTMLQSIKTFAASERPVYAECGGMIYLSRTLSIHDGTTHLLVGALPFAMEMTKKLSRFGYVTVELTQDCLLGTRGTTMRGHSFHYSRITNNTDIATNYSVQYSLSKQQEDEGYSIGNVLGSYVHLHFRAVPSAARHLVEAALAVQRKYTVAA